MQHDNLEKYVQHNRLEETVGLHSLRTILNCHNVGDYVVVASA